MQRKKYRFQAKVQGILVQCNLKTKQKKKLSAVNPD